MKVNQSLLFVPCIIMVGRIGKIKQSELIQATEILNRLNLLGIIANEASQSPKIYA